MSPDRTGHNHLSTADGARVSERSPARPSLRLRGLRSRRVGTAPLPVSHAAAGPPRVRRRGAWSARLAATLATCITLAAGAGIAGCGSSSSPHLTQATLILDFTPNAVHAGIYRALAAGYYRDEGIDLHVVSPTATSDTLKLIDAGSAQFGLADGSDVANLIAKGGDARAVMAIAQRPLGGLIALASEHLHTPADLQGRTVGITGVPSDRAVLDTEVTRAGGDPRKVHVVTVGFNGPQALLAGRIAAFTGFIPDEGVALRVSGHPITAFPLDSYGGPPYPGLVAFSTRRLIASDPSLVRGFVAATVHGYEATLAEPQRSLEDLLHANPTLSPTLTKASLNAYLPLFEGHTATGRKVPLGMLQPRNIRALSRWMFHHGLVEKRFTAARYGTNRFLPGHGSSRLLPAGARPSG